MWLVQGMTAFSFCFPHYNNWTFSTEISKTQISKKMKMIWKIVYKTLVHIDMEILNIHITYIHTHLYLYICIAIEKKTPPKPKLTNKKILKTNRKLNQTPRLASFYHQQPTPLLPPLILFLFVQTCALTNKIVFD